MAFETGMYQNFQGGSGLAALAQGLRSGFDFANQQKQQKLQAERMELEKQQADRQAQVFASNQAAQTLELQDKARKDLGNWGVNAMSLPDDQFATSYNNFLEGQKRVGVPVEKFFPSNPTEAKAMTGFYADKAKRALEMENLELASKKAQTTKLNAETAKLTSDLNRKGYSKEQVEAASNLRKERSGLPVTRATQDISSAYNRIQNAAKDPSAAGDLSLIFGYMKMLDPGSTVREGEFANAQNAAGVPTQVANIYNRLKSGERLSPEQRADFMSQAGGLYQAQLDIQQQVDNQFSAIARRNGVDPNDILLNFQANNPGQSGKSPTPPKGHGREIFKTNEIEW